ncbi:hypothetical protein MtrunA17_Chr4g0041511 [Medicago truncatula]|uniref:Uncharacterized protein n=1 Tax=Medicago truncatula TaxID=3880 RepID=A0A396IGB9_MEDTR|nr:hypothetical protein MtrunA17_Chr4g0041511 [Medicago truncatula]
MFNFSVYHKTDVKNLLLNFKANVPHQRNKGQMWKRRFHISSYLM